MYSRCGIETVGGKGKIFITGEVTSSAEVDVESVVKDTLQEIGYSTDYTIINNIGKQSPDIAMGVDVGGAGDQGMMFGFACNDTLECLPRAMCILQRLAIRYDKLCHTDKRFLPDGKAQITGIYSDDRVLTRIKDFTISYQNTEIEREETDSILIECAKEICRSYGIEGIDAFHINPTGKFLIGGFEGDAGLTGRKIVVDNYQSFSNVGGGCYSGKDPSKVDRSAAYKAREIAVDFIRRNENLKWCQVQLAYAIGIETPLSININTDKGRYVALPELYEMCTPKNIIESLRLRDIYYAPTARYGHFGFANFPWERGVEERVFGKEWKDVNVI